ncbi:MAG: arylsulfatase [Bacteroidales bacterium]
MQKLTHRKTILISGAIALTTTHPQTIAASNNTPYNVIYILCDDLGYGDLGCYGQEKILTPNIDKMAKQGMRFTDHYAGCTVSAPSRASLMTGLHTGNTLIRGNYEISPEGQYPMSENTKTIAHIFKQGGYSTGLFGKWGLGHPGSSSEPTKMGFDNFFGYNCQRQAHSYYPTHLWRDTTKQILEGNQNGERNEYSQDLVHEAVMDFIRTNRENKFFACCTYTLPHAELAGPNDSILALYKGKFQEVPYTKSNYSKTDIPYAQFAAMVTRLDTYVGEILDELKRTGLEQNTIVMFTSDNGPHREGGANPDYFQSYGELRGTKRDLYEGGIRVPLIAWAPSLIKAGSLCNLHSAFWDMMPTFAEIAQVENTNTTDGISILPTLKGKKQSKKHEYLYWEFHEQGGKKAIRVGDWKLIALNVSNPNKESLELYNLKKDIHEDVNLIDKEPKRAKRMRQLMESARVESEIFNFGIPKK